MCRSGRTYSIASSLLPPFLLLAAPTLSAASLVGPGDIAFIRFNADGFDDFSIVLLADGEAGDVVFFNNKGYSAQHMIFGGAGKEMTWTLDTNLAAGTVVTFSNLDSGSQMGVVSSGMISGDALRTFPIDAAMETIYAYVVPSGSSQPVFIAAVSTQGAATLDGTNLVAGDTAVVLPNGIDEAHYKAERDTLMSFPEYRTLIGNVNANWQVRTTDTGTLTPGFDTTNFTLAGSGAASPESPRMALLCLMALLARIALSHRRQPRHAVG